uniref:Dopa decarboxylase n=1 Tax=Timema tahoe TaxID=61484 RepID=A0A7R9IQ83_9NEOP|nr:unnamed protein product [Timema tahoe]
MASPACTELEVAMMDWLGKMLDLPQQFLNSSEGPGGGVIQGSASEATLVGLLAAKERTVRRLRASNPDWDEGAIKARLVAYTSDQSNSSVEKAGLLGSMPMRLLTSDNKGRLRASTLEEAMKQDIEAGLIPCYVVATLGTTGTCAFDPLEELGTVCNKQRVWLHVDAAYAGAAFICPEYRYLMAGVDKADSFNFNPHKWMLVNFDCSALWVKDASYLVEAFNVERIYLKHNQQGLAPDYRHWQIPLGRRFRALKLWFVLRLYGVEGLQKHIREPGVFGAYVRRPRGFRPRLRAGHGGQHGPRLLQTQVPLSLASVISPSVCHLRSVLLQGEDAVSKRLLERLTARGKVYMIPATVRELFVLRFVVCSRLTESRDVRFAWDEVKTVADEVLGETNPTIPYNLPRSNTDILDCAPIISYKVPQSNTGAVKLLERGGACFQDEVNANNCQL